MSFFVNSLSIRRWAETTGARSSLPHLIRRLVLATVKKVGEIDFPAYESVQRPGFDGVVACESGNAWVPDGKSVWELSTEAKKKSKAKKDLGNRSSQVPVQEQSETTYVCLTGRFWKNKKPWIDEQRKSGDWKDIRAFDSDDIEQWLEAAPGVAVWFANQIGQYPEGFDDIYSRWKAIEGSTQRELKPQVFLTSRDASQKRLIEWLNGNPAVLSIESQSPVEVIDFYCAAVESMDEQQRAAVQSRSVIIESAAAWRALSNHIAPAILVADASLDISPEEIVRAVSKGHHVLIPVVLTHTSKDTDDALERASEHELGQALEKCGYTPVEAEQAARSSGGNLAILKRRLSRIRSAPRDTLPNQLPSNVIVPCLLLGAWSNDNPSDRAAVELLAGRPYREIECEFQRLASCKDPLLLCAAGKWRVISIDDAWAALGDRVSATSLHDFRSLAIQILAEDDPKFELPDDQRWMARVQGHAPKYSDVLKTSVAKTLAFLGSFGENLPAAGSTDVVRIVDEVVRAILTASATWHRWASLGSRLTLLAETSPRIFLQAVQEDLEKNDSELVKLFHQEGEPLFSGCNHAGLLWALETLAWSSDYFVDACLILLSLSERDPGGRWSNRPKSSLCEILCNWIPHTTATIEERIRLLGLMVQRRPATGWDVLLGLLSSRTVSMPTHRPTWRAWANSWIRGATRGESIRFITAVCDVLLVNIGLEVDRWQKLLNHLGHVPASLHERLLGELRNLSQANLSEEARRIVSDELSEQINRHQYFDDADWSLPSDVLASLEEELELLKPKNAALRHAWLFEAWPDRYYSRNPEKSYAERELEIESARITALSEVIEKQGFDGVAQLIAATDAPHVVGWFLAQQKSDEFYEQIIPGQLVASEKGRSFAGGYVRKTFFDSGWEWADRALERCGTPEEQAWLLILLPLFEEAVWDRVKQRDAAVQKIYWQNCQAFAPDITPERADRAVQNLIEHLRPATAVNLVGLTAAGEAAINSETLFAALEGLLAVDPVIAADQMKQVDGHRVVDIIESLQSRQEVDQVRLARLEWNFISLLDGHHGHSPTTLHKNLVTDPKMFVEVLSVCFKSRLEADTDEESNSSDATTERRVTMATHGYRLLHSWTRVPGSNDQGDVDEASLRSWCVEARRLAKEIGRLEVCDNQIGNLFSNAPSDPDGKWPCHAVRSVIESIATREISSGFYCGVANSRGVVARGRGGDQERELATKYSKLADAIRYDSPFVANVLAGLADRYGHEGKEWDEDERWGEP